MGGFPHSEICGSKVAHTSPQLIAACHVLHRLYAPRHPRIALTSRLRVHTTNDNAGSTCQRAGATRNSAEQRIKVPGTRQSNTLIGPILVWMILSQPDKNADRIETRSRAFLFVPAPCSSKVAQHRHGIDFKNPFTMSKWTIAVRTAATSRGSRVFIIWKLLDAWWSLSGSNR